MNYNQIKYSEENYVEDRSLWKFKDAPTWYTEEPRDPFIITTIDELKSLNKIKILNSKRNTNLLTEIENAVLLGSKRTEIVLDNEESTIQSVVEMAISKILKYGKQETMQVEIDGNIGENKAKVTILNIMGADDTLPPDRFPGTLARMKMAVEREQKFLELFGVDKNKVKGLDRALTMFDPIYLIEMSFPGFSVAVPEEYYEHTYRLIEREYSDFFIFKNKPFELEIRAKVI